MNLRGKILIGWLIFCNLALLAGLFYDLWTNP